jgi:hypothetical protein
MDHQSYLLKSQTLFHITQFGAMMHWGLQRKKNSSKYVEFWKQCIDQDATYAMKMAPYIEYWEDILLHLSK